MDFDKIKQLASEHPDQVDQGIEKGRRPARREDRRPVRRSG